MKVVNIRLHQIEKNKLSTGEIIETESWISKPFPSYIEDGAEIDTVLVAGKIARLLDHQTKTKLNCHDMTNFSLDKRVIISVEVDRFMLNKDFLSDSDNAKAMQMLKPRYSKKGEKVVRDYNSYNEYFITLLDYASILMESEDLSVNMELPEGVSLPEAV
jgi:hypothetical protein